ncbi:MAG TPA: hydrogenase nickel incorporation protein HypB [Spirochaetota bacterium]|nr:hydrogenase nickel incorporation protein HypB [Spirochaetota bacterium]HQP50284.1 hydrogenase nickel incorporation protein HypB [Spirochaetota bacterium]
MEIKILENIFESNREMAEEIRSLLKEKKVYMIDIMSSPGAGKTTLTDTIIGKLKHEYRFGVIEGDIKTATDAEKLAKHDIPIVQIETSLFGGDCHLESSWIMKSLDHFDLDDIDCIIIENVGNLVCPAEFELGDDERMVVLSVTEGEDKPIKYPLMFNSSRTMVLSKTDLLPYLPYNIDTAIANARRANPDITIIKTSALSGEGIGDLLDHLRKNIDRKKSA